MNDITPQNLFNLLVSKDYTVKTLDSNGKEETDLNKVEMFSFDFEVNNKNFGTVVILLNSQGQMELFYADAIGNAMDSDERKVWSDFLYQLRMFAKRNMMGFKIQNINKLKYSMQGMASMNESFENIFESYYGTKRTSYSPQGNAKIIIKHSKNIGEEDKRYRNISSIFIENADGERFKLPFKKLNGARAMARHVTEGGNPYDIFGLHITEMVKDIATLGGFMRRSKIFAEDEHTAGLVETGGKHYTSLRKNLKQIAGKRGYHTYKESWKPAEITETDTDVTDIRKLFTEKSLNQHIDNALPLLARLSEGMDDVILDDIQSMYPEADEIDVYGIQEDMIRNQVLESPELFENKTDFKSLRRALAQFKSDEPVVGNYYAYASVMIMPIENKMMVNVAYTSSPYKLLEDKNGKFVFDINGEPKVFPHISSVDNNLLKQFYLFNDTEELQRLITTLGISTESKIITNQLDKNLMKEVSEFEQWANKIVEGPDEINDDKVEELRQWFSQEQPLGINALNATDTLYDILGNDELFNHLGKIADKNPDEDARPIVRDWISKNDIELAHKLNLNGEYDNAHAREFPREGLGEEKDLDSDEQCLNASEDDKITNKGDGMKPFKDYVDEAETNTEQKTEELTESKEEPNTVDDDLDLTSLMQRTNFLLQK